MTPNNKKYFPFIISLIVSLPFCASANFQALPDLTQILSSFALISLGLILYKTDKTYSSPIPWVFYGLVYLASLIAITPFIHYRPFSSSWLPALIGVISLAIFSLAITNYNNKTQLFDYLCKGLLLGASANALFGILQWFISYFDDNNLPIYGFINQRNLYVQYLTLGSIALAYLWNKKKIKDHYALPLTTLLAIGAALGGSRASFLYLLALLPFCLLSKPFKAEVDIQRLCNKLLIIWAINLSVMLFPLLLIMPQANTNEIKTNTERNSAIARVVTNMDHAANNVRLYELKMSVQSIIKHPILGIGWDGFALEQQNIIQGKEYSHLNDWPTFLRTNTHNAILQLFVEYGLFAIPILLGFLYLIWHIWYEKQTDALAAMALLAVLCIQSMVEYPLWNFQYLAIFIILITLFGPIKSTSNISIPNIFYPASGIIGSGLVIYSVYLMITLLPVSAPGWIWKENRAHIPQLEHYRDNFLVDYHVHNMLLSHWRSPTVQINNARNLCKKINNYRPTPQSLLCEAVISHQEGHPEQSRALMAFSIHSYPQLATWTISEFNKSTAAKSRIDSRKASSIIEMYQ
ncbi:O-antigen ligase family protein [Chitinibacter bivalviorum]|uniref:O-antigen ligase family protein n=1 Tax=Chitinibacter bivalviorum TaxID=2739434 RepID=A0A7H9BM81_9NEIS|nr:O-antigen ligase family protein [Chitinibacter bivalviorum]QLG89665.1 O-antigen ligase family protein [Chitinibacter bivalviorum]